jgi:hypothetical protein
LIEKQKNKNLALKALQAEKTVVNSAENKFLRGQFINRIQFCIENYIKIIRKN